MSYPVSRSAWVRPLPALALLLALTQCSTSTPAPQLPAETTTGANTFGCKIDGKIFVPTDAMGKPGMYVAYDYLGAGRGGGYFLNITATDQQDSGYLVQVGTDSLLVQEGKTYPFRIAKGSAKAICLTNAIRYKLDSDPGELTITRFDRSQRIMAGRFYFTATEPRTGRQVQVTDGRFDLQF